MRLGNNSGALGGGNGKRAIEWGNGRRERFGTVRCGNSSSAMGGGMDGGMEGRKEWYFDLRVNCDAWKQLWRIGKAIGQPGTSTLAQPLTTSSFHSPYSSAFTVPLVNSKSINK